MIQPADPSPRPPSPVPTPLPPWQELPVERRRELVAILAALVMRQLVSPPPEKEASHEPAS
jgi:hypothetical protein